MIYGSVAQAGLRWAVLPILPEVTSQLWSAGSWPGAGWSQMTALIGLAPGPAPGWWAGRLSGSMPTAHPASCRGGGEPTGGHQYSQNTREEVPFSPGYRCPNDRQQPCFSSGSDTGFHSGCSSPQISTDPRLWPICPSSHCPQLCTLPSRASQL